MYLARRFQVRTEGNEEARARRRPHDIRIEFNLSIARSGFVYRGAQLWNMIPINVRTATTARTFKKQVKQWIKSNVAICRVPRMPYF